MNEPDAQVHYVLVETAKRHQIRERHNVTTGSVIPASGEIDFLHSG